MSPGAQDAAAEEAVAVVHLVWAPLGPAPLREFLRSYRSHDAGLAHDLVIALNGRDAAGVGPGELRALEQELRDTSHRLLEIPRSTLDLAAYGYALATLAQDRVCLLNSYSRIRADDWLAKLDAALTPPRVGLVGASGSWASQGSYALFHLGLPSPYRRVYGDRRATINQFRELERARSGQRAVGLRASFDTTRKLVADALSFPPFPAAHLRTNAFMGRRELLASLLPDRLRRKVDAYRLESGPASMTRRVQQMGLDVLVVDREGRTFQPPEWAASGTFWQADQARLLVADNQSDTYQQAGPHVRLLLSRLAWGQQAAVGEERAPA